MNGYRRFSLGLLLICAACSELSAPPSASETAPGDFDVAAKATAVAARSTAQAADAQVSKALADAQRVEAQNTAVAHATDRALDLQMKQVAIAATSTAIAVFATSQSAQLRATDAAFEAELNATREATRVEQQAVVQAAVISAQSTQVALVATGTSVATQTEADVTAAAWQIRVITPAKAIALVVLLGLCLTALGFFGVRLFDAVILRVRIVRDPSGHAIVLPEPDRAGRRLLLLPHRSPGAVLQIVPPTLAPQQVLAEAIDTDVTQRAQVIEAIGVSAAQRPSGGIAIPKPSSLLQAPLIRVIGPDQLPPPNLADTHAVEAIDADWRRLDE